MIRVLQIITKEEKPHDLYRIRDVEASLVVIFAPKEVADILHVGKNTTYDLIRSEKIKSIRIGHNIRIPKNSLLEFLQEPNH